MEVTRHNFKEVFPLIEASIKECDFLAIDGEFTGLTTIRERQNCFDTVVDRYKRLRRGSQNFQLLQYGICCFIWNEEKKKYDVRPFSCYIFPRPYKRNQNDIIFTCQSSSLDFLSGTKFDFNKVFHDGVSYMPPWEEKRCMERLERQLAFLAAEASVKVGDTSKVFIPKKQREFIDGICEQVASFLRNDELKQLDLKSCDPFQRKLTYETLEQKYPMGLYLESVQDEATQSKFIRVIKVTESGKSKLTEDKRREEMEELDEVLGFTKVMRVLSESQKLVIGHNMMLDTILTTSQFFARLPEDVDEFKALVQSVFHRCVDTKLMACTMPLRDIIPKSGLASVMQAVEDEVLPRANIEFAEGFDTYDDEQYHDAGYDAFCTGSIFIGMSKQLFTGLKLPCERIDVDSNILQPFMNRINLYGIHDIAYMDLLQRDVTPCRKHFFYVNYPKGWKESDLDDLFSSICTLSKPVMRLNDTTSIVALSKPEKKGEVMKRFVNARPIAGVFVTPYDEMRAQENVDATEDHPQVKARSYVSERKKPMKAVVPTDQKRKSVEVEDVEEGELDGESSESSEESDDSDELLEEADTKDRKELNGDVEEKADSASKMDVDGVEPSNGNRKRPSPVQKTNEVKKLKKSIDIPDDIEDGECSDEEEAEDEDEEEEEDGGSSDDEPIVGETSQQKRKQDISDEKLFEEPSEW